MFCMGSKPANCVETTVELFAPPAVAYQVLTDFAAYPSWNPMIGKASGKAAPDSMISLTMKAKNKTMQVRVQEAASGRKLSWVANPFTVGGCPIPGIYTATRSFDISVSGDKTLVKHTETYNGVLSGAVMRREVKERAKKAYEAFNVAFKGRCEQQHAGNSVPT